MVKQRDSEQQQSQGTWWSRAEVIIKIVAAFPGMHVLPAKHSSESVQTDGQTDRQTDRQTDGQTDDGQSDPYVPLCFAGDTKIRKTLILAP